MSDRHLRILMAAARHSQRRLDDARDDTSSPRTAQRRRDIEQRATRTRARVAAARARRPLGPPA